MDFEREMTLNDYLKVIKRRLPYVIGVFLLVFTATVIYSIWISPTYQASATILIESQQVKAGENREKYVAQRFDTLKQLVLSKENLVKIAQKYKLFGLDKNPNLSPEMLYGATRSGVFIERLREEAEGWESGATFAFKISFYNYDAENTYNVTNDLVKLFLDENERASKERALGEEEFFSKEAEKRKEELDKIESKVTNYKRLYADSLPENKDLYVASLDRLENDLKSNQAEYRATQAELRSLDVSLESARSSAVTVGSQERITTPTDLDALKLELAKQKSIYTENHPSVRVLQRRIDSIESTLANTAGKNNAGKSVASPTSQSFMVAKIQAQIDTAKDRLESLKSEESSIRAKISHTERSVVSTSQTEGALASLLREYEAAKTAYADIKSKLDSSKIAKNIEIENKGEHFVLIEEPVYPDAPIKPNRKLIIFAGFFASIAAAIGFALMMERFDSGVRGVDSISAILNIQPMATIPYITTKAELNRNRNLIYISLLAMAAMAIISLTILHFFVMPLDTVLAKVIARF
jgi:polysaccharide biosynthesis transport protein